MKSLVILLFLISGSIAIESNSTCKIIGSTMDCTSKGLVDCPIPNLNVEYLIMDRNNVKSITGTRCGTWTHLSRFRINENKLSGNLNFSGFKYLIEFIARDNNMATVTLEGSSLATVDLSHNRITNINVKKVKQMKHLLLGNNFLQTFSFFKDDVMPHLSSLDLSFNNLANIPPDLQDFHPISLTSLSLAGNNIKVVFLIAFKVANHEPINLDLSFNQISTIHWDGASSVKFLNVSHNQISFINTADQLSFIKNKVLDFSYNPFNCSCTLIPPFVNWMKEHKENFQNRKWTNCRPPSGANIFHLPCHKLYIKTTIGWVLPLLISMAILLLLSVAVCAMWRHKRSGYVRISDHDASPRYILPSWVRSPWSWYRDRTVDIQTKSEMSSSEQQYSFDL